MIMNKTDSLTNLFPKLNDELSINQSFLKYEKQIQKSNFLSQQQQLLNKCKNKRKKLIRRLMYFVSFFNFITFLCLVFSMSYYQWIHIQIAFNPTKGHKNLTTPDSYWINQLYMKKDMKGSQWTTYQSFNTVKQHKCSTIYCQGVIQGFKFSGYLCFSFFIIAALVQIFDFSKMIYSMLSIVNLFQPRGNFRHAVLIGSYFIGLTLSVFSMYIINGSSIRLGISFWVCLGVLILWPSVLAYGQFKINKIQKQILIQNLLQQEKKLRNKELLKSQSAVYQSPQPGQIITL